MRRNDVWMEQNALEHLLVTAIAGIATLWIGCIVGRLAPVWLHQAAHFFSR